MLEEKCSRRVDGVSVTVLKGDITQVTVDAIVNPANSYMVMGGGVAYAIKKAGGSVIEEEALKYAPVPVGKAVATTAGRLPAKYVIHAPTMERPGMSITVREVEQAVIAALRKAEELCIESIAFPGMGTGVGGVPYHEAARTMVDAIKGFVKKSRCVKKIYLVGYTEDLAREFCLALEKS